MRILPPLILAAALCWPLAAATLGVTVQDAHGGAIRDAVVYALPVGRSLPLAHKTAVMDQKNRMFIPHILTVQTGTSVRFPNSDDIRHHVYSFSPAKPFQLPLYKGTPSKPVLFDRAGVVALGCNIHDQMSAYIIVVDTPYFDQTPASGRVTLRDVEAGRYTMHVWYPEMHQEPQPVSVILAGGENVNISFVGGKASTAAAGSR
jgi:plastocyanin